MTSVDETVVVKTNRACAAAAGKSNAITSTLAAQVSRRRTQMLQKLPGFGCRRQRRFRCRLPGAVPRAAQWIGLALPGRRITGRGAPTLGRRMSHRRHPMFCRVPVTAAEPLWQAGSFPGGRFWVDLYSAREVGRAPDLAAAEVIATACGERPAEKVEDLRLQARRLIKQPPLVLLDGAETVEEANFPRCWICFLPIPQ
jgi:hypothetical protein